MKETFESRTLSVTIDADPKKVYAFASNPENLPKWATGFCKAVRKERSGWVIETDQGPIKAEFSEKNDLGVLDHCVYPNPDVKVYVPMRVVANGAGSEVIFTLFKPAFMEDAWFKKDIALVEKDLNTLKKVLEA